MRRCRSQMFFTELAFNQNLASWNVKRVASISLTFDSTTALVDCFKKGMYTAWGATLQKAYPTWSSLSTCTTRCASCPESTSAHMQAEVQSHARCSHSHVLTLASQLAGLHDRRPSLYL